MLDNAAPKTACGAILPIRRVVAACGHVMPGNAEAAVALRLLPSTFALWEILAGKGSRIRSMNHRLETATVPVALGRPL